MRWGSRHPHYSQVRFAVEKARLVHWKPHRWTGISWLANRFSTRYEKMFAFLFPTQYLEFRLRTLPAERRGPPAPEGDGP